jgi:hypothetical protein
MGLTNKLAAANAPLHDEEVLAYLHAGLPVEYDPFVTSMTTKSETLSLDDVFTHLVAFEARRLQHQADMQLQFAASAKYAGRGGFNCGRGDRGRGDRGRGGRSRGSALARGPHHDSGSWPECQICGKVGHTAIKCWYRMDDSYQEEGPSAALASSNSYRVDPNWYSDTSTTDHITSDLHRLAMREQYHGGDTVQVGNGAGLQILHTGSCSINTNTRPLALNNVLHVPNISKHLLSVHKLSRDNNVFFEFHPWYYFIKDRATRKLLLEGMCENGLYPLKSSDVESLHQAFVGYSTQPDQWYARFGHPSSHIVRSILRLNNLPCLKESSVSSVCNACQLAKSHPLPYNTSIHCTTMPLEIIHSDVWGPAPISVGGYKYYISFIDDFMKFTWIYLMVDRTEAQHIFLQFQKHVERLLDNKIRCVQFDWGEEYQKLHNQFFTSLDIVHHVSCSHTHQQNGSVERKHRHIVETGLALLAHASMPLKFWDEAFLTSTYLINCLPTRVLDNLSPVERLFKNSPNYCMLNFFGCACWPHLQPYNKHKLEFCSKPCVFLGYSSLHKGYKYLDMETGRVYISRDVIFDEVVFPFSNPSSNFAKQPGDSSFNLNTNHL